MELNFTATILPDPAAIPISTYLRRSAISRFPHPANTIVNLYHRLQNFRNL
ncbi:hypothetical protein INP83_12955 [Mucilaginibacter sp. 21P]|uniref:hypothetical protein n=1 Tax=Mucilaginibacter sp. 21P TaxID=2778902 RepID=UPI001C58806E|nr:hypothetical protein [Mucilaginibacter sp. 21P]QXV64006.1 hypothetical protein INP83_12955 [Mucilaginibacter sp. 21P]